MDKGKIHSLHIKENAAMPSNPTQSAIRRHWDILLSMPTSEPGLTIKELLEKLKSIGYNITRRTLERDLLELESSFGIICIEDKPSRWYLTPNKTMGKLPGVSITDALTLSLVESSLRPLLPQAILKVLEPRFEQARRRLDNLSKTSQPGERWIKKIASVPTDLPLQPPEISEEIIDTLQDSLLNELQIECIYKSATGKESQLILNPLSLIQRGRITYLLSIAKKFSEPRLFAVHRFLKAKQLDTPSEVPDDFCLKTYIANGAMQFGEKSSNKIKIKAWICDDLARQLTETPLSEDMLIEKLDSGNIVTSTQPDSWQLRWWILMQSGRLVIQEPTELREEIISQLENALSLYKNI